MEYKGVVGIEVVRSCDHDLHFTTFISPDDGNDVFTDSTPDWPDYVFSDEITISVVVRLGERCTRWNCGRSNFFAGLSYGQTNL